MSAALIVAVVCLALQAFFSGSEMALVSVDRLRVRRRAAAGERDARRLEAFHEEPQRLLATTLLGTNLAVVTSTVVVTLSIIRSGRPEALAIALLSPLLLIFGEIIPKTVFQQHADRIAPRVIGPLWIASYVLAPVWWSVGRFAQTVTRWLGIDAPRALVTREELKLLLKAPAVGAQQGEITEGERRMIRNIFDFSGTTAKDVMVPLSEVFALPETASLELAAREAEGKQHTRIPVYRDRIDQVVGILHVFDLLRAGARDGGVSELARPPIFVPEGQPAVDLLVQLQRERQGMAVVVDEYGGAVGVVTIEDILEEIVGEIEDEYDRAEPLPITAEAPGVWRVRARTPIEQVNASLRTQLPEGEDYESIGGLVIDRLKRIPRVGEEVRVGPITIEVLRASERQVEEVRVRAGKR